VDEKGEQNVERRTRESLNKTAKDGNVAEKKTK
jgi:hypothetical protein